MHASQDKIKVAIYSDESQLHVLLKDRISSRQSAREKELSNSTLSYRLRGPFHILALSRHASTQAGTPEVSQPWFDELDYMFATHHTSLKIHGIREPGWQE
jgi:hypothetical protein